jgi:speckle-type POZ protein
MRYRIFIQQAGNFVPWGDVLEVCKQDPEALYEYGLYEHPFGPDVCSKEQTPTGIFGMTHDDLIKSNYVQDDTLTVKVEIELRSAKSWERCQTSKVHVEVPGPTLHSNFQSLLEGEKLSDVTFVVEGERFKAHRSILAARSDVFDRQLCGSMRESREEEVIVDEVAPATFKALLLFMYTDSFEAIEELIREAREEGQASREFTGARELSSSGAGSSSSSGAGSGSGAGVGESSLSTSVAGGSSSGSESGSKRVSVLQSVLAVAHRYQATRLRLWCEQQLCECINQDQVCALLCQAHLYDATQLERVCLEFIKAHHAAVVVTPHFGNLTTQWPEVMLKVNIALAGVERDKAAAAFEAQQQADGRGGQGGSSRKRKRSALAAADAAE